MTREEAIEMWVIPALKNTWNEKRCNEVLEALDQEPCEDAISRQEVLEIIRDFEYKNSHEEMLINSRIKQLPSVTPAENPNKWMAADVLNHWIGAEVLDKIRAEIEQMPSELTADGRRMIRRGSVFRIIDKYNASLTGAEGSEE